jgi:hypothetical protein
VTGQHPFLAAPPRDVRDRIVQDKAPLPNKIRPETPGGYNTVLFKLLQKDPAKRPARGAEVAQSLRALHERLLHPPTPVAAPAPAGVPAHAPTARAGAARRGVPPVALAAAAALVLVAAAAAFLVLRQPSAPPAPVAAAAPTASPAEIERLAGEVDAALRAEDFQRAERLLAELRQLDALDARVLDLGQRTRDLRAAKAERLYDEGVALARRQRVPEARQRFLAVLEVDPGHVDARDRLDELSDRRTAPAGGGTAAVGATEPAMRQRVPPTAEAKRLLHVVFRSPLAKGEVRVSVDHRPLPAIVIDLPPAEGGGLLGTVQRTYEVPHGTHQVLVTLVNERGNILGDHTFVLKFEAGREHRVAVEMASARAMPRFTATALR